SRARAPISATIGSGRTAPARIHTDAARAVASVRLVRSTRGGLSVRRSDRVRLGRECRAHETDGVDGDVPPAVVAEDPRGLEIHAGDAGLIVEELLGVRARPVAARGVPEESAVDL